MHSNAVMSEISIDWLTTEQSVQSRFVPLMYCLISFRRQTNIQVPWLIGTVSGSRPVIVAVQTSCKSCICSSSTWCCPCALKDMYLPRQRLLLSASRRFIDVEGDGGHFVVKKSMRGNPFIGTEGNQRHWEGLHMRPRHAKSPNHVCQC